MELNDFKEILDDQYCSIYLDRKTNYDGNLEQTIPDYSLNLSLHTNWGKITKNNFKNRINNFRKRCISRPKSILNEKLNELYNSREVMVECIERKFDEIIERTKTLRAIDHKSIEIEKCLDTIKKIKEIEEKIKQANIDKMNKFYKGEDTSYGSDKNLFYEEIFNLTYYMSIKLRPFESSYNWDSNGPDRYKTTYIINTNSDFIDSVNLKNVSKDFKFDDYNSKKEAKEIALEYIEGRKKYWKKKLFSEIQPPLPIDEDCRAKYNDLFLPGYSVDLDLKI
jgi:hypothetical protein